MSVEVMTDSAILKRAQRKRNETQVRIAEKLGIKASGMCGLMNRRRMSLESFAKILDVLDYDVVIADRETGDVVWRLEVERPELDDDI